MIWRTFNALTRQITSVLVVQEYALSDPLTGAGQGVVTASVNGVAADAISRLRENTTPDITGLVLSDDANAVAWCGLISKRPWKSRSGQLAIGADEMKSYLYDLALRPGAPNLTADGDYLVNATEQQTIARQLAQAGLAGTGALAITVPTTTPSAAVNRSFSGRRGDKVGDLLDTLSKRDGSIEWWIETTFDDALRPTAVQWTFRQALQRSSRADVIRLFYDQHSANIDYDEWPEDTSNTASSVTALGEGTPPDQAAATDNDPGLAAGTTVLRETTSGPYSGVVDENVLAEFARTERAARQDSTQSVAVTVDYNQVPPSSFFPGDRAGVRIVDEWLDIDLPAVRILSREVSGGAGKAFQGKVVLNLADAVAPDTSAGVDTGGQ